MAKEFEIVQEASKIARQAWNKWGEVNYMVATPEARVTIEQAIGVVANHPHVGQVAEGIYVGRQSAANGIDNVVDLTAVWEGASRLAGDPAVRGILLEKNSNRWDLRGAIALTIHRDGSDPVKLVYRTGEIPQLDVNRTRLVDTVLGNIVQELI